MKILCEYFRMYHYIFLGKTGKIHRYHWKSGGKTVEKHTGGIFRGMWLWKIEAQGRIGPLRRRMQGRASLVRVCEANNCPQGNHAACRSGFASGKLHSFRMPDKQCLSLRQRMTVFGFFGGALLSIRAGAWIRAPTRRCGSGGCCRSVRARGYAPLRGAAAAWGQAALRGRTMKKRLRLGAAWMCLIDAL